MPLPRSGRTALVALALMSAALPASAAASAFHAADRYDCEAYQAVSGGYVYVDSYQFLSHHRYAFGLKSAKRRGLSRTSSTGRYKRSGSKIIPLSGEMKKDGYYLLIQKADLALMKSDGTFTSIGCYDFGAKPSSGSGSGSGSGSNGGSLPLGQYDCYHVLGSDQKGYQTQYATSVTFFSDGTYVRQGSIRGDGFKQDGSTIDFTAGPFWSTYVHDVGTYSSTPVAMPHDAGGAKYTLIIKSTKDGEVDPPMTEFTGFKPESFDYCALKS